MFVRKNVIFFLLFALISLIVGCTMLTPPTPNTYTIISSAGEGGTISPLGETLVTEEANQSFTITPDEGYIISEVLVDGESVGPLDTYTFTDIQENHTISVIFAEENQPPAPPTVTSYTIIATAGIGGSIDPEGSVKVTKGNSKSFTITPLTPCYEIEDVLVDGESVGAVDTYTFTNVKANHTIEVSFFLSDKKIRRYDQSGILQDDDYTSMQEAIDDASEGDTIIVCPGTYYENITIAKNITLQSIDPNDWEIVESTIINGDTNDDGDGDDTVVTFDSGDYESTFRGFTITNGSADEGGGIYIDDTSPTITNNIIEDNEAYYDGGGIYVYGYDNDPTITITENIIRNNKTNEYDDGGGGGGIYVEYDCELNITRNEITGNYSATDGGGIMIYDGCIANIAENSIRNNTAYDEGGGISVQYESDINIAGNEITGNDAGYYGGGIYVYESDNITIQDNTISTNTAYDGGGIGEYYSTLLNINNNMISNNTASSYGGGIEVSSSSNIAIADNSINSNTGFYGGGIDVYDSDNIIIQENTIIANTAYEGGGAYVYYGDTDISNNDISDNIAENLGGGIYVDDDSALLPSTDRPTGWGDTREDIPTGNPLDPAQGELYTIAGNDFLGNLHGDTPDYTEGAHVYFE